MRTNSCGYVAVFLSCVLQYVFPVDYSKPSVIEEEELQGTAVEETVEEIAKGKA